MYIQYQISNKLEQATSSPKKLQYSLLNNQNYPLNLRSALNLKTISNSSAEYQISSINW